MDGIWRRHGYKLLQTAARLHPLLASVPAPLRLGVGSRVAVCREHRFVYFRLPKCANSTVARTLAWHAYPERRELLRSDATGRAAKESFNGLPRSGALTATGLARRYQLLAFFRDPFARLLSAYLDKIRSGNQRRFGWVAQLAGVGSVGEIGFEDFVSFLEGGGLYLNAHWAPQTSLCPVPVTMLDHVGHIERLEVDLKAMVEDLFGAGTWVGMFQRLHNRQYAKQRLSEHYTPALARRVHELYRADFEQLGYPADFEAAGGSGTDPHH